MKAEIVTLVSNDACQIDRIKYLYLLIAVGLTCDCDQKWKRKGMEKL